MTQFLRFLNCLDCTEMLHWNVLQGGGGMIKFVITSKASVRDSKTKFHATARGVSKPSPIKLLTTSEVEYVRLSVANCCCQPSTAIGCMHPSHVDYRFFNPPRRRSRTRRHGHIFWTTVSDVGSHINMRLSVVMYVYNIFMYLVFHVFWFPVIWVCL